jgi:hypothetical protein
MQSDKSGRVSSQPSQDGKNAAQAPPQGYPDRARNPSGSLPTQIPHYPPRLAQHAPNGRYQPRVSFAPPGRTTEPAYFHRPHAAPPGYYAYDYDYSNSLSGAQHSSFGRHHYPPGPPVPPMARNAEDAGLTQAQLRENFQYQRGYMQGRQQQNAYRHERYSESSRSGSE